MVGSPTVRGVFTIEIGNKEYSIHVGKHGCASFLIMIDGWIVSHT
jgi:hypothetical protein